MSFPEIALSHHPIFGHFEKIFKTYDLDEFSMNRSESWPKIHDLAVFPVLDGFSRNRPESPPDFFDQFDFELKY